MFLKIDRTAFPPSEKPMMVWDGECGFCKYWISYWKSNTEDRINYKTFQQVSKQYPDIPLKEFKKASRLIETDGSIFSGPDSAFRAFKYFADSNDSWNKRYSKNGMFTSVSDQIYIFIAKNRSIMFKLTKLFFGNNPEAIKPYWFILLLFIISIVYGLLKYL